MESTVQHNHLFFVNPLFYFWVFSIALLGAAVSVVAMRNIIHCALSLALSFICTAGIFILFGAEFLAAAMMSQRIIGRDIIYKNRQSILASIVSIVMALVLIGILSYGNWGYVVQASTNVPDNTKLIGRSLMLSYTLAFWVAGCLLTVTMIGALMLAKKD
jgi:NADH:ubiquinone oxidoreductase subunit 6 (subunit J)